MRKIPSVLLAAAIAAVSLSACSAEADKAKLVIWADEVRGEVLKPYAKQFGEDNGIEVSVEVHAEELQEDFITASEQGKGPDILVAAHDWIGNLVQNKAIDPVQLSSEQKKALDPTALEAVTYDGDVYGNPYAVENLALIRNTKLAPEQPKTIEDLTATGKKLKKDGKTDDILSIEVSDVGNPYHAYPFYASAGGYLFGQDDKGQYDPGDLGLSKPEAVDAFAKLAKLGEDGVMKTSMSADNSIPKFVEGKTPYLVSGPWALSQVKKAKLDYEVTEIPGFKGGKKATPFVGVQAFYVASKGDNKTHAQEFVTNYAATEKLNKDLFEADPRMPALTDVRAEVSADNKDIAGFEKAGEGGTILPAIPAMSAVWDPFGKAQAAVLKGEDPEKAVKSAAKTITEAIG
ncbi:sugar ABC transporter substrate-binding protein [Stackebrandtia nassauensis]|uniref:Extracellular solute-binding protein family 1 n=1 Tax=Stackebrandtia nassauensis (strain DSM 44728 / CIP 108903 / NRRL B-16338 / NBRC 102104 / LLR-40K-21) TaxID=446470 RepID=D3PZ90_STANL|nr:maltose ABC transporter substrate-binding protein [Stackebrandtia nassauensis]ADD45519.1 extracellular solute-binding protein family 1 [Stackebrandtia nassauensis DSM 44728]